MQWHNLILCHIFSELILSRWHEEKALKTKMRQATAVVGDMQPLHDALPTLEWLEKTQLKKSSLASR